MKKNAMLKIAAILLVAVLLTTCAISATFAKYVTSTNYAGATARVAKWGVNVSVTGTPFAKVYKSGDNQVVFSDTEVVAPGTQNKEVITVAIDANEAEVAYEIISEFKVEFTGDWLANGDLYIPVIFTVGSTEVTFGDVATAAEAGQKISNAINDAIKADAAYVAGEKEVTIGWKWPSNDNAEHDTIAELDAGINKLDTALGNVAESLGIKITGSVAVVQVASDFATAA